MSSAERRRGAGGAGLRTGPSPGQRQNSGGKESGQAKDISTKTAASGGSTTTTTNTAASNGMPAPPPKAAMINNGGSPSPDDAHEGREGAGGSTGSTAAGGGTGSSGGGGGGGGAPLSSRKDKGKDSASPRRRPSGTSKDKHARERDTASPAATAALLREKDERIAYLEKEMDIMEREFHRELDNLSQNESETAVFWQNKHSALNHQFLRADTELRLLRAEAEQHSGEREELRRGWEVLQRELRERDAEVRGLRSQIRGLKEFVSTSTRTDGQTCDEEFGDGMTRLGNGLQNWVIVHFRKVKLDLSDVDEATLAEVGDLVPTYEELSKVHLVQSLVSRILAEMVFDAYYVGLSEEQTTQFRKVEELLSSLATSDEPINQWRSSTLSLFRRDGHADHLQSEATTIAETVISRINRLLDALLPSIAHAHATPTATATSSRSAPSSATTTTAPTLPSSSSAAASTTEARDSALRVLVNNAIELSRLIKVQKAVLRIHMPAVLPHQRTLFDASTMEDMGGVEDDEGLASREICCVVFPGLIKRGDESGTQLHFENVITKARVLCSPEE